MERVPGAKEMLKLVELKVTLGMEAVRPPWREPLTPVLVTNSVPPALLTATVPLAKERLTSLTSSSVPAESWWKLKPADMVLPRTVRESLVPVAVMEPGATVTETAPLKEKPLVPAPAETVAPKEPEIAPSEARSRVPAPLVMETTPPKEAVRLEAERCTPVMSLRKEKSPEMD
jgi:hypothetical protein